MRLGGRRGAGLWVAFAVLGAMHASAAGAGAYPMPQTVVGDAGVHDPSLVVRGGTPRYLLLSTHSQSRISADRTVFVSTGKPMDPVPEWTRPYGNGNTWAPDVSFHDDRYWLYYSASQSGSQRSAIGVATSLTAEPGSWVDRGMVIDSSSGMDYNAIDPNLLVDASGRWWLTFGSHWRGIYTVELDPATGKIKSGATPVHLAERSGATRAIEGAVVFRRGGYYYLFASFDGCCPPLLGASSPTYNVRVGRSTSPTGPYLDRNGVDMLAGGGTKILESHDHVRGPGGQSVVHDPSVGRDLLVYHWYDSRANYYPFLGINFLTWDAQGWPVVT